MLGRNVAGVLIALVDALALVACSSESPSPTPAPTVETTQATASETAPPAAVATASGSAATEAAATLSGKAPPIAEATSSASARRIDSARVGAISDELAKLDLGMLDALNSDHSRTDKTVSRGDIPRNLLDEAAASDRGVGMGGGGDLRPGSGGGRGLAALGETGGASSEPKISGKPVRDATAADLQKALEAAGCTLARLDSPAKPPSKTASFDAKCKAGSFILMFIESGGNVPEDAANEKSAAIFRQQGVFVSVKPGAGADLAAARELLKKLVVGMNDDPKGSVSIGGASMSGGTVANASAVVAGMAAGFRRCYNRGLQEDPTMKGSLRVTATIGPKGEVANATSSESSGLSSTVTSCVAGVVSSRMFDAPDGGKATIVIPVTFTPQ